MTGTTGRGSDLTRFARCGGAVAVTAALLAVWGATSPSIAPLPKGYQSELPTHHLQPRSLKTTAERTDVRPQLVERFFLIGVDDG